RAEAPRSRGLRRHQIRVPEKPRPSDEQYKESSKPYALAPHACPPQKEKPAESAAPASTLFVATAPCVDDLSSWRAPPFIASPYASPAGRRERMAASPHR